MAAVVAGATVHKVVPYRQSRLDPTLRNEPIPSFSSLLAPCKMVATTPTWVGRPTDRSKP